MDLRGSESEAASDEAEASDGGGFGDTDEDDTLSGGPRMLVAPPSGAPLGGRVWDSRDEAWSGELRGLYDQAWEGMNKPSWYAYPGSVKKLLLATVALVQHGAVRCARRRVWCPEGPCARAAPPHGPAAPPRRAGGLTRRLPAAMQGRGGAVPARAGARDVCKVL
jgi:hypothetical protein